MSLDLAPDVEQALIERAAAAEGTTASELIARLLRGGTPSPPPLTAANDPVLAFLQARLDAAQSATPDEAATADREWEVFTRAMNETRRDSGEGPLYP